MCGSSARGRGGMKPTAIRCWRFDVRSIMAHWTRCLCGTNSGCGKRQNDRMLPMQTAWEAVRAAFDQHAITQRLAPHVLAEWKAWALQRTKAFQRTSSAVEGRNGYLSQMHQ